jgi:sugar fermentation stimulation protein A
MRFPAALIPGTLLGRYKRFLADVRLAGGEIITATCPNTGSMIGLIEPGSRVWLSESDNPTRKYRHTWELVEADLGKGPALVGINTGHPNKLVEEAILLGVIKELRGLGNPRREVKYGKNSRIDILLEHKDKGLCYVEVKNVHLSRKAGLAEFPDSKTERGVKHLGELANMVAEGHRAIMLYLIQRGDVTRFQFAEDIDPAYAAAFGKANAQGVEALAYACDMSTDGIEVSRPVPIELPPGGK